MSHTMPMLTDSERENEIIACLAAIQLLEDDLSRNEGHPAIISDLRRQRIALACLTATSKTMRRDLKSDRTWIECGKDYYLGRTFYTAPPVPTIKLPEDYPDELYDFFDCIYDDRGRVHSAANAVWEMALVEVKRLNGVKE